MGVTFFICDVTLAPLLDQLVGEMEAEDPLADVADSAYDRFADAIATNHLQEVPLAEDASEPAQAFYEWFHYNVSEDLDKLYLTRDEAARALASLERTIQKHGQERLVSGYWNEDDLYPRVLAVNYLDTVRQLLKATAMNGGLMVICYQ